MSQRTIRASRFTFSLTMISLASAFAGTRAMADPLYTITDLGTGPITFTTASGATVALATGNGLTTASATTPFVSVSTGQGSYAFSTTPDTVVAQSTLPNITSSTPLTLYGGLMNGSGTAVISGVSTDVSNSNLSRDVAYSIQQNSAGSSSQPALITTGPQLVESPYNYITIVGLSKQDQDLLMTSYPNQSYGTLLYSISTKTLTNLSTLSVFTGSPYFGLSPIALDDQGRILLHANEDGPNSIIFPTLLLTPEGVTSGPPPLSAPEPDTMLIWGLICAIAAASRFRAELAQWIPDAKNSEVE